MLPFLKKKDGIGSLVVETRKPDEGKEPEQDSSGMEACAADILSAIESKDIKALAAAIQAAFELADSQPHEEGMHEGEEEAE